MVFLPILMLSAVVWYQTEGTCSRIGKLEYQPYGIIMCKDVCACITALPQYREDRFSCQCLLMGDKHIGEYLMSKPTNVPIHVTDLGSRYTTCGKPPHTKLQRCHGNIMNAILGRAYIVVQKFIQKGKVHCEFGKGITPGMISAGSNRSKIFDLLIKAGYDLCLISDEGDSILHYAAMGGNIDIAKRILNTTNLDINKKNKKGNTPIFNAAKEGHLEMLKFLMKHGADAKLVNARQRNLLHVACAKYTPSSIETVKLILDLNITDIESKNGQGNTPVLVAAELCNVKVVKYLQTRGCNMNVTYSLSSESIANLTDESRCKSLNEFHKKIYGS